MEEFKKGVGYFLTCLGIAIILFVYIWGMRGFPKFW